MKAMTLGEWEALPYAKAKCQNGGCERLATIVVTIFGLGDKHLCYHCHQALSGFGMLRTVRTYTEPVTAA
jgi:hypothetical protein